jgi:hypothetical protein
MKINFFVIARPRCSADFPTSYVSAFRVEPGQEQALNELASAFPERHPGGRRRRGAPGPEVIDQLIAAVQFIFFSPSARGAGALLGAGRHRGRAPARGAVMRVYGASRAQVTGAQRVEFLAMGRWRGSSPRWRRRDRAAPRAPRVRARPAAERRAVGRRPAGRHRVAFPEHLLSSRKVLRASPAATLRESVRNGTAPCCCIIYSMAELLPV